VEEFFTKVPNSYPKKEENAFLLSMRETAEGQKNSKLA
jgi:hypothetical protein